MDASLTVFFRVETQGSDVTLAHADDDVTRDGGNSLNTRTHARDDGRSDEASLHRNAVDSDGAFLGETLVAEGIAFHGHIQNPQRLLPSRWILQLAGGVNQTCTRGEDGEAGADGVAKRRSKVESPSKTVDRGGLATLDQLCGGDDPCVLSV